MAQSPYLSKDLKEYIITNQIESKVNKAVNEMLRQKPEDPFGSLVNLLGEECSSKVSFAGLSAFEIFNNEFRPTLKLNCSFKYKMAVKGGFSHSYNAVDETNSQILFDSDVPERFEGKGMTKACDLAIAHAKEIFEGVDCNDAKRVDEVLRAFLERNQGVGINITLPLSIVANKAVASLLQIPLYQRLNSAYLATENFRPNIPQLFLCILSGSKVNNSKCKPARFYYILPTDKSAEDKTILARNLSFGVRKVIASGKLGEGGVKQLTDGSFICPYDTINDNLKMLDEVINQNGVKDVVKIGIEWAAENLFQAATGKYELENPNPKNHLDVNQLVDFYVKLCSDRPSIAYMEDPLIPDNKDAWVVLKTKFQGKNVKFGSRKLYNTLENAKKSLETVKAGEESGLTEEQAKLENDKRIILDYAVLKYGEFPTLTSFYQVAGFLNIQLPQLLIQDNNCESEDAIIVDIATSINKSSLLLGPPLKSERLAKFNRIIEIEDSLSE